MSDRCATCDFPLPEASPASPEVRYCELDWWAEQRRRHAAGEPVHPNALAVLLRES